MKKHCCRKMSDAVNEVCEKHPDRFECPDCLIHYSPEFDEFGIIVHDGGASSILISFCPWCGTRLPESKRDLWFEELARLGFDDPFNQKIPERYQSDGWYLEEQ